MENNGKKLEHRLTALEVDMKYVKSAVSNHLPTQIEKSRAECNIAVNDLRTKFWWMIALLVTNLIALIGIFIKSVL